jgi:5-aminolevulinate synthase
MDKLVRAVDQTFTELNINRLSDWKAAGGRAGVGLPNFRVVEPIWTDQQIGLLDGTAPRTLRMGQTPVVDLKAANAAKARFTKLLGPNEDRRAKVVNNAKAFLEIPGRAIPEYQPVAVTASA